jgi:hypothetical protein
MPEGEVVYFILEMGSHVPWWDLPYSEQLLSSFFNYCKGFSKLKLIKIN